MACKKSELVSAINSFAAARVSGDPNLLAFSARLVEDYVNSLDYESEDVEDTNAEPVEQSS